MTDHDGTPSDGPTSGPTENNDLFSDLNQLRLPQSFDEVGVRKIQLAVSIRKPNKQEFIRTHPDDRIDVMTIELQEERETYLVPPDLALELSTEANPVSLVRTINRQGVEFIWPLKTPTDGRSNSWWDTAREASAMAMFEWVRVRSNMSAGYYDLAAAEGDLGEPAWSDASINDLLRIAFKGRVVETVDHPLIQRLRGLE